MGLEEGAQVVDRYGFLTVFAIASAVLLYQVWRNNRAAATDAIAERRAELIRQRDEAVRGNVSRDEKIHDLREKLHAAELKVVALEGEVKRLRDDQCDGQCEANREAPRPSTGA